MKIDILVIGGSAGGMLTATTAKKIHKDKSVLIVRKTDKVMVPCGIPYIFGTLNDSKKNRVPDEPFLNMGIKIMNDEVVSINKDLKTVLLISGTVVEYEKLVIATGSLPIEGSFIKGYKLRNVYPILKDEYYLQFMHDSLKQVEDVVVIGGGFIGVEFAEQLAIAGKNVTLVEAATKILATAFDDEVCDLSEKLMKENGIDIKT
ncbi:MAG: FAD-dependent oxidoreductase, partial [Candidatus Izemoplasma sp.]